MEKTTTGVVTNVFILLTVAFVASPCWGTRVTNTAALNLERAAGKTDILSFVTQDILLINCHLVMEIATIITILAKILDPKQIFLAMVVAMPMENNVFQFKICAEELQNALSLLKSVVIVINSDALVEYSLVTSLYRVKPTSIAITIPVSTLTLMRTLTEVMKKLLKMS